MSVCDLIQASREAARERAARRAGLVPVLREIFAAGARKLLDVAAELNARDAPTISGTGRWHACTVQRLLGHLGISLPAEPAWEMEGQIRLDHLRHQYDLRRALARKRNAERTLQQQRRNAGIVRAVLAGRPMKVIAADYGLSVQRISRIAVCAGAARRLDVGKARTA